MGPQIHPFVIPLDFIKICTDYDRRGYCIENE